MKRGLFLFFVLNLSLLFMAGPFAALAEERHIYLEGDGHMRLEKGMVVHWEPGPEELAKKGKVKHEVKRETAKVSYVGEDDSAGWYMKGYQLLHESEDYREARKSFEKAIELDPGYADAYVQRGNAFAAAYFKENFGNIANMDLEAVSRSDALLALDPAFMDYEKAIELDPKNAGAYSSRGGIYAVIGRPNRAMADLDKAVELDPEDAESYTNRGFAYLLMRQPATAIKDFDMAIKVDPEYALAYKNRGTSYLGFNQSAKAISNYNRYIELRPDDAEVYLSRGMAYLMEKDEAKACLDFKKACDLGNCDGVALSKMSGICGEKSAVAESLQEQAEKMMEELQKKYPK
jgi:tetratricopeptide (TPR) repeat protein